MEGLRRRGRPLGVLAAAAVTLSLITGCQTVRLPEEAVAQSNLPREKQLTTMPAHIIEPPDLLLVEALNFLPNKPIQGEVLVRPDGTISLGYYGTVYVTGLTLEQAKVKIILHLRKYLTDEALGLVRRDIETDEIEYIEPEDSDAVVVDITAYNSKYYHVLGDVNVPGRFPITGSDTVIDAIGTYAQGLNAATASTVNVRLVRPAPPGACCAQILPINLAAITQEGDITTNYQLFPGDRIFVYRDPLVRLGIFVDRLAQPFNTVVNSTLTYAIAARSVNIIGEGLGLGAAADPGPADGAPLIDPGRPPF